MNLRLRHRRYDIDMLNGPVLPKLLSFALPLMLSSMLQLTFNAADVIVVGRFEGDAALAAVGANGALINLLVNLFLGLSVGANVVVAQCCGAGDYRQTSEGVHTSIALSLEGGVLVGAAGFLFSGFFLGLMSTPEEVLPLATSYMRIYFLGMPANMLYNFGAAILRAIGDTRRPLIVLAVSGVLNVALNLLLVCVFHMAAEGVAIATVVSNVFNSLALWRMLLREEGGYRLVPRQMRIHGPTLRKIIGIGLPAGIQSSMFSISNVIVQSSINALGASVIAGTTVGLNAEFYSYQVLNGFSQAATTFVSQNYAVNNLPRVQKIVRCCLLCGALSTLAVAGLMVFFRDVIISIFTTDPMVAAIAGDRMLRVGMFQFLNGMGEILSGSMRGMRRATIPAIISILSICGVRLLWIFFIYPLNPVYEQLIIAYPLSWLVSFCAMSAAYILIMRRQLLR